MPMVVRGEAPVMTDQTGKRAAAAILCGLALAAAGSAVQAQAAWPPSTEGADPTAGPDSKTVRDRLNQRHKSHAAWTHDALKLRPDQEAGWRAMLAVLAPDHLPSDDRDVVIGRFYASLDPAQQHTFDQLVAWARPPAGRKCAAAPDPGWRRTARSPRRGRPKANDRARARPASRASPPPGLAAASGRRGSRPRGTCAAG